ncbi:MAG: hypothetical protein ABW047_10560 [Nitrospiraceae bacterium]
MSYTYVKILLGILGVLSFTWVTMERTLAAELQMEGQLNPMKPEDLKNAGKKGGPPAPPADPQCPIGSSPVGPIEHSTVTRACKVNGKDGVKSCYHKMVACTGGAGEPSHAHSENCGPCVVSPDKPGQMESPTGR